MDSLTTEIILAQQQLLIDRTKFLTNYYQQLVVAFHKKQDQLIYEQVCIDQKIQNVMIRKQHSIDIVKLDLAKVEEQINCTRNEFQIQVEFKENLKNDYQSLSTEQGQLKSKKENLINQIQQLRDLIKQNETQYQDSQNSISSLQNQIELASKEIKEINNQNDILKQDIQDQVILKRQLINTLQESKGTIRVYCRVRAFLQDEQYDDKDLSLLSITNHNTLHLQVPIQFMKSSNNVDKYSFHFDQIFDRESAQLNIFNELQQLIASVIDGHHVCIFAYGQTGSGKTYTMQGQQGEKAGVIPRAVSLIFNQIEVMNNLGAQLYLKVGFHEIYNETIRDLISNQTIEEINQVKVNNMDEIGMYFLKATENRKVAETQCNEFSSRSHFIFQLQVCGNNIKGKPINGALNLIDLAGSERLNQCKTEGDRLKETQAINKSLTALGDVINALAQKEKFVPYRNSKLTHVLYQYMQGKTLMLVNISPRCENFQSTLQSLRFAEKVKNCKPGNQQQNKQMKK